MGAPMPIQFIIHFYADGMQANGPTRANRVARAVEIIRADPANAPTPTVLTQRLALAKRLIRTSRLNFDDIARRSLDAD